MSIDNDSLEDNSSDDTLDDSNSQRWSSSSNISCATISKTTNDVNTSIFNITDPLPLNGQIIPISMKGNFFEDHCFKVLRNDYIVAVRNILQIFQMSSDEETCLDHYRSLRSKDPREDNQAIFRNEDSYCLKVRISFFYILKLQW